MGRFTGRVGLVTGGASGIGRATVTRFVQEGGRGAVVDKNGEAAEKVAAEIRAVGGEALAVEADVSSSAQVSKAVEKVVGAFGAIDVLVNCAGGSAGIVKPVTEVTDDEFQLVMGANIFGAFLFTRAVAPLMIAKSYGRIVNIGSRTRRGEPRMAIYAASKTAMEGFTRSVALELGPHGITVNVVAPGSTITPQQQSHADIAERRVRTLATIPVGRFGQPEDQAAAILFLASEEAGYITSEILTVSGGRYHSSSALGIAPRAGA